MDEKINNLILAGEITALTIDTSIFEKNSLALESGLLAQLDQFHESEFELVIAHTVANEVKRHLAKNATEATKALHMALKHTAKHRALSSVHQEELTALSNLAATDDGQRARSGSTTGQSVWERTSFMRMNLPRRQMPVTMGPLSVLMVG